MWSLRRDKPEILTYGGRKRQHLVGAVEPRRGKIHIAFFETLKAEQFQHFLEGFFARYPEEGKIIMYIDNARAHHAKRLEPFLDAHKDKLELLFLPHYSPNLNPMEWSWKLIRKKMTYNTFFSSFKKFQRAVIKFIIKYKYPSQEIKSLCCFAKFQCVINNNVFY